MIMKTSLITENYAFLNNLFAQFSPVLLKVEFGGDISVFAFSFDNESELSDNWRKITSSVAAYYQSTFDNEKNDFERWNIYILFLVQTPVDSQLKYRIENDKFSSRKIVHDESTTQPDMEYLQTLIDKYVVDTDITITEPAVSKSAKSTAVYSSDSCIYRIIDDSPVKTVGKAVDKEGIENLYQQILNEIRHEIQKSRNTGI